MKNSFSFLEENISSLLVITIALTLILINAFGFTSSYYNEISIAIVLVFILLDSLNNRLRLEKRIDRLSQQIAEGNPNAVFKLSDQNQSFANVVKGAQSDLLLVGPSFVGFLSTESHVVIQSVERGLKVRVALLDPSAETLLQHISQSSNLRKDVEYSLAQLEKIKELTSKLSGLLEIRLVQTPLSISGLQADGGRFDGTLIISLFASSPADITNGPHFVINKRTSNELFESLSRPLEILWDNSQPYVVDSTSSQRI